MPYDFAPRPQRSCFANPSVHTCDINLDSESGLAGSAGKVTSTVRVSTPITATGIPPKFEFKFLVLFILNLRKIWKEKKYYQDGHVR